MKQTHRKLCSCGDCYSSLPPLSTIPAARRTAHGRNHFVSGRRSTASLLQGHAHRCITSARAAAETWRLLHGGQHPHRQCLVAFVLLQVGGLRRSNRTKQRLLKSSFSVLLNSGTLLRHEREWQAAFATRIELHAGRGARTVDSALRAVGSALRAVGLAP